MLNEYVRARDKEVNIQRGVEYVYIRMNRQINGKFCASYA